MCTSISFCDRGLYGRNLDLEYHFGEQVVITPRDYPFSFHHRDPADTAFCHDRHGQRGAGYTALCRGSQREGAVYGGALFSRQRSVF